MSYAVVNRAWWVSNLAGACPGDAAGEAWGRAPLRSPSTPFSRRVAAAVRDRSRELTAERPPDWSPVEGAKHKWAKSTVARVVSRAMVALAIGVVLWLLGRHVAAVVLVAVLFLLTAASLLFPSVAAGVDRGEETVRRVGRALAFVLLGVVHLLVFTPVSPAAVARHDRSRSVPGRRLDLLASEPPKSGRPLYRRPFAYERLETARPGGGRRLRAALAFAALVLLIDVGVGALLHARDKTGDAPRRPSARACCSTRTSPPRATSRG